MFLVHEIYVYKHIENVLYKKSWLGGLGYIFLCKPHYDSNFQFSETKPQVPRTLNLRDLTATTILCIESLPNWTYVFVVTDRRHYDDDDRRRRHKDDDRRSKRDEVIHN